MSAFQEKKEQIEQKMLLKLMSKIEDDPAVSQRHLARELGIALGLMNAYLKRCIKKGWVRAGQVPAKRLAYFLTPEGLKEKGRMVKDYIAGSLTFFRDARTQCELIFSECLQKNWRNIALVGEGDLAEIAKLVGQKFPISLVQIKLESAREASEQVDFHCFDAVFITDIQNPQETYEYLENKFQAEKINKNKLLILELLHISRHPVPSSKSSPFLEGTVV